MRLYCLSWVPGGIAEQLSHCAVEVMEQGLGGKISHQCYGFRQPGGELCGPHRYEVETGKAVTIPPSVGEVGGVDLRQAKASDLEFFYLLRADPVASRMSRRPPPTMADHVAWWETTTDHRYVAECDRVRVGTIRVSTEGVVSIIVHKEVRGLGLGEKMLRALEPRMREAGVKHLIAEVAGENVPSQRIFLKADWAPILFERWLG